MKKLNENTIARETAKREGGKLSLSIAQIKECQRHLLDQLGEELAAGNAAGVVELIERHVAR